MGSLFGPYAYQLLSALNTSSSLNPTNLTAKPQYTTAKISWTPVSGASGYAVYVVQVTPAANSTYNLTGNVNLATVTNLTNLALSHLAQQSYYAVFVTAVDGPSFEAGSADIIFQTK